MRVGYHIRWTYWATEDMMARSATHGSGNRPMDNYWIDWMRDNGGIQPVDTEAEDIPFPAKIRWSGNAQDEGSPWMLPPEGKRCAGKAFVRDADGDYVLDKNDKRIMRPCHAWPMRGMTVCLRHGGGIQRVRRAAMERLVSAMDATTGALIRLALDETADSKARLGAMNSILDRTGLRGGTEIDLRTPEYMDVLRKLFEEQPDGA